MARPRSKSSTIPYGGLGLEPEEEKILQQFLEQKDYSLAKLKRFLIREWIKQQKNSTSGKLNLVK